MAHITHSNQQEPETQWLFIDEAGDPTLFNRKGKLLVGQDGCSRFFMIGKLEVADPPALARTLSDLRRDLLADPYFAGVESFKPERQKTAILLHTKNDLPEVRYEVFKRLRAAGDDLRFHAVICDKAALAKREMAKREQTPGYRYRPDSVYDALFQSLFSKFHRVADKYEVCVARRGKRDRNQAIRDAIEAAEQEFEQKFWFRRGDADNWSIVVSDPKTTVCLQAVDYFLWAVQRFYERREDRFLNLLWPQIGEIHDMDFGPTRGTYYTHVKPLTLAERFEEKKPKNKKS